MMSASGGDIDELRYRRMRVRVRRASADRPETPGRSKGDGRVLDRLAQQDDPDTPFPKVDGYGWRGGLCSFFLTLPYRGCGTVRAGGEADGSRRAVRL
jgi:hypothetical protein